MFSKISWVKKWKKKDKKNVKWYTDKTTYINTVLLQLINKWHKIREFKLVYLKIKEIEKKVILSFDCGFNSV